MSFGFGGNYSSDTRVGGMPRVMTRPDRQLPKVLPSSLGSAPYDSAKVWANTGSSSMQVVLPILHCTAGQFSDINTTDDTAPLTTVSIYLVGRDDATVNANDRLFRIPLTYCETAEISSAGIVMAPGDYLLAVDDQNVGVNCYIQVLREI